MRIYANELFPVGCERRICVDKRNVWRLLVGWIARCDERDTYRCVSLKVSICDDMFDVDCYFAESTQREPPPITHNNRYSNNKDFEHRRRRLRAFQLILCWAYTFLPAQTYSHIFLIYTVGSQLQKAGNGMMQSTCTINCTVSYGLYQRKVLDGPGSVSLCTARSAYALACARYQHWKERDGGKLTTQGRPGKKLPLVTRNLDSSHWHRELVHLHDIDIKVSTFCGARILM